MERIKRIHLVGIGGSGMAGIAEVLKNQGFSVTGSDKTASTTTAYLSDLGIPVHIGHQAAYVDGADAVVISTAIPADNPERLAAQAARIPVVPRAEMLAELMRFKYGIAVAGTHGKTTTTSLVSCILAEAGFDPTFVIGGKLNSAGANACLGEGRYFVAEADESDASFLYLKPMMSIVTNIDADHMGTYDGDFNKLTQTFLQFIHHLPFYGLAVLCVDDSVVRQLLPQISRPILTYGMDETADVYPIDLLYDGLQSHFSVMCRGNLLPTTVTLNLPGRHNVLNALAAIALSLELGVPFRSICASLEKFSGVGRRFQVHGDIRIPHGTVTLVDDYGHHPREVEATIAAARLAWPDRRLLVVYQPHRYTRTRDLYADFVRVLSTVDVLLLLEVYAAGEQVISGADSQALAASIKKEATQAPLLVADLKQLEKVLSTVLQDGDVLLMQGAGNIGAAAASVAQKKDLRQDSLASTLKSQVQAPLLPKQQGALG